MDSEIIDQEQLMKATGYEKRGLKTWLKSQGIRFFTAKGGRVFTTRTLLNQPMLDPKNTGPDFTKIS